MSKEDLRSYACKRIDPKSLNLKIFEIMRRRQIEKQRRSYLKLLFYISLSVLLFILGYTLLMCTEYIKGNIFLYRNSNSYYSRSLSELVPVENGSSNWYHLIKVENDYSSLNRDSHEEPIRKIPSVKVNDSQDKESCLFYNENNKKMFDNTCINLEDVSLPLSKFELMDIIDRLNEDISKKYIMSLWLQAMALSNDLVYIVKSLKYYIRFYRNKIRKCVHLTTNGNYYTSKKCNDELAKKLLQDQMEYNTKLYKVIIIRHM
ncbi:Plasmodium exported protein (PHIST), unknown function [Plasmodium sp. gorilla clade G2]|uniref:Plasmodium exported protein (PHIST), unknown function n=1 Tax=Plasmodium sp. gorilla clade G2 TaxID=880535 RepID=UPI000D28E04E|nr:Plasmodium exported protein (PHIST), unknown function [Plasmodium sp. gorilla clade G2]SOV20157.1 Plasmodium exported protein (PHIST), unknown function [Plasmodium sp. gorilla clade G2]